MSQSVARALQLLIHLGSGPANLDELAELTGVHKTTVLRLLRRRLGESFVWMACADCNESGCECVDY